MELEVGYSASAAQLVLSGASAPDQVLEGHGNHLQLSLAWPHVEFYQGAVQLQGYDSILDPTVVRSFGVASLNVTRLETDFGHPHRVCGSVARSFLCQGGCNAFPGVELW